MCSPTCSHASHIHQPPFWDSRQDHNNSVPLLQSTYYSQHIGHFPRQEPQLLKAPLHFFAFSIYPPKGRVWWSLSSLQNTWIQNQNIFFWKTIKLQCTNICKLWKIWVFHNWHINYYFSRVLSGSDQAQILQINYFLNLKCLPAQLSPDSSPSLDPISVLALCWALMLLQSNT